jgi:hypothetical protein
MQMGTQGRYLVLWKVPNQEGIHNSPTAGKDPSRRRECADSGVTILLRLKEYLFLTTGASL